MARDKKIEQNKEMRMSHISELRNLLYGSLSFGELKPHIVLEYYVTLEKLSNLQNKKSRAYHLVSEIFPVSQRTVRRLIKEYESDQIFK